MINKYANDFIKKFLHLESLSGIILLLAALCAFIWANSPYRPSYQMITHETFLFVVNEGLMTFFFLVVGLELKRSYLEGKFSQLSEILLPLVAATFGMLVPAFIFYLFNSSEPSNLKGWAIPVATDIAFALGVLTLFNHRVPLALKLFLLALAIFDDIGAIIIIAIFYTHGVSLFAVIAAIVLCLALLWLNRTSVQTLYPYFIIGVLLWFALLYSGVHPTLAGIVISLAIPGKTYANASHQHESPVSYLESALHPWVAYIIMPLFALVNAGFTIDQITYDTMTSGIVMGTACGLFFGKQIGVTLSSWLIIRLKYAQLPHNASWLSLYGVALLCGIGFTMSLFLGTLSFPNEGLHLAEVRLGVIMGSILSGICGALVLLMAFAHKKGEEEVVE